MQRAPRILGAGRRPRSPKQNRLVAYRDQGAQRALLEQRPHRAAAIGGDDADIGRQPLQDDGGHPFIMGGQQQRVIPRQQPAGLVI